MRVQDSHIDGEQFAEFLQQMPQVSVELLVEKNGGFLLARRENEPAKGEWFVPGSRLYKGETFDDAVDRIADEELSIQVCVIEQLGAYNHFWESGALSTVEETHTVNVVYHVQPKENESVQLDEQHGEYIFTDGTDLDLHPYIAQYLSDFGVNCSQ